MPQNKNEERQNLESVLEENKELLTPRVLIKEESKLSCEKIPPENSNPIISADENKLKGEVNITSNPNDEDKMNSNTEMLSQVNKGPTSVIMQNPAQFNYMVPIESNSVCFSNLDNQNDNKLHKKAKNYFMANIDNFTKPNSFKSAFHIIPESDEANLFPNKSEYKGKNSVPNKKDEKFQRNDTKLAFMNE